MPLRAVNIPVKELCCNARYTDSVAVLLTEAFPFLNEVRRALRLKHLSHRAEASYLCYILGFICFHGKRHPKEMGTGALPEPVATSIIHRGPRHEQ